MYICMYILSPPRVRVAWDDREGYIHIRICLCLSFAMREGYIHIGICICMPIACMCGYTTNQPS